MRTDSEIERLATVAARAFIAAGRTRCAVSRQWHRDEAIAANDTLRELCGIEPLSARRGEGSSSAA